MKIATLILGFVLIILAAYLFTTGSKVEELRPYENYFWIPIPLGILLFIYTFLQKGSPNDEKG